MPRASKSSANAAAVKGGNPTSSARRPNIYRYFENREGVLLHLWVDEVRELTDRLEHSFERVAAGDIQGTARAVVDAFTDQPRLCELTSIVSPVLERKLSVDAILAAKRTLADLSIRVAQLLHGRLPSIPLADCAWAGSTVMIYVAGIWPAVNTSPLAREALARPEFAGMQPVFERDLARFLEVLFRGCHGLPD